MTLVNDDDVSGRFVRHGVALQRLDDLTGRGSLLGVFLGAQTEELHHPAVRAAQSLAVQRWPGAQPLVVGVLVKTLLNGIVWECPGKILGK